MGAQIYTSPSLPAMEVDQETRRLRYLLKQANATVGRQGETIHRLRSELAEVRTLNSKLERGELRRLERQVGELAEELLRWKQKVELSQKLAGE